MTKTRMIPFLLLILCTSFFLSSQEVVEEIVAVVNDDIITLSEYEAEYRARYQMLRAQLQGKEFSKQHEFLKRNLLNEMITNLLLSQEAGKKDLNVEDRIRLYIDNLKKEYSLESDEELARIVQQQFGNYDEWKKTLRESLLRQAVIAVEVHRDIVIDDAEVVNYYKLHPEEFKEPIEYKLKAIYLSTEMKSNDEVEAKKREISGKIESGEDFAALAAEYSDGPGKERQGDLGSYKKGELEKSLEQAVEKLEEGEITPWLIVRNGYYLLKLEERKEERLKSFEEVRKEIEEKLFTLEVQKKLEEYLKKLKEKSYIKILKPNPLDF